MAFSGLDIYKLLPKTNCRQCGFPTCLAFALGLAKKQVTLDKCPYISPEAKQILDSVSQPPIKLVTLGEAPNLIQTGNETVMFRHEEKFYHPTAIGFLLEDSLSESQLKDALQKINNLQFERVGQVIKVDLIAIKETSPEKFINAVKTAYTGTNLGLVLISQNKDALRKALEISAKRCPLIYAATLENYQDLGGVACEFNVPLAVSDATLDGLADLTQKLNALGVNDLVLDPAASLPSQRLWDITQIRRLALKKTFRALGYPVITIVKPGEPFSEIIQAATFIAKYSGIVILKGFEPWQALSLLTLRQNIYTDPQKPLQVEPKLYPIGQAGKDSPLIVTTNFSLTYYTVLGEVESSKTPSYILSIDTEGMSVLTAWAAEKFTPDKIVEGLQKNQVDTQISHKNIIIPGYVAVMSGDLEEKSGRKVIVGPREASGIPAFLKSLG